MNRTKKAKDISMTYLQKLVKKHHITKSGSKKEVAMKLLKGRPHMMTLSDLTLIEDYLKIPPSKRYKGSRYYTRKNGRLYCASGICPED